MASYTSAASYAREQRRRKPLHVQREGMMLRARPKRFARPSALVTPHVGHPSVSVDVAAGITPTMLMKRSVSHISNYSTARLTSHQ